MKIKCILALLLVLSTLLGASACTKFQKSDAELIEARINAFFDAYNDGDYEGILNSLDSRTRTVVKASFNIGSSVVGDLWGVHLDISDIFGLAMGVLLLG